MSYIDINPHSYCGSLGGLPLYHPEATYMDELDFLADAKHLVLGGGSGEHAALVLEPVTCVSAIVNDVHTAFDEAQDDNGWVKDSFEFYKLNDANLTALYRELEAVRQLNALDCDFSNWSGLDWYGFVKRARKDPNCPHRTSVHGSIEYWIQAAVGEFVVVSMPGLLIPNYPSLQSQADTLDSVARMLSRSPRYGAIQTLPVGYDSYGRGATMSDANMHR